MLFCDQESKVSILGFLWEIILQCMLYPFKSYLFPGSYRKYVSFLVKQLQMCFFRKAGFRSCNIERYPVTHILIYRVRPKLNMFGIYPATRLYT